MYAGFASPFTHNQTPFLSSIFVAATPIVLLWMIIENRRIPVTTIDNFFATTGETSKYLAVCTCPASSIGANCVDFYWLYMAITRPINWLGIKFDQSISKATCFKYIIICLCGWRIHLALMCAAGKANSRSIRKITTTVATCSHFSTPVIIS